MAEIVAVKDKAFEPIGLKLEEHKSVFSRMNLSRIQEFCK